MEYLIQKVKEIRLLYRLKDATLRHHDDLIIDGLE